jgi:hypothetical protein
VSYELGDCQWDIPGLRTHLETIVPEHGVMDAYEVDRQFPKLGHRTMLLNACKVFYEGNSHTTMLLGIEDITGRRVLEREREELLRKHQALVIEKDVLLKELEHRVGNSLQIIAAHMLRHACGYALANRVNPRPQSGQDHAGGILRHPRLSGMVGDAGEEFVLCECGWRPDLGEHYRVHRPGSYAERLWRRGAGPAA